MQAKNLVEIKILVSNDGFWSLYIGLISDPFFFHMKFSTDNLICFFLTVKKNAIFDFTTQGMLTLVPRLNDCPKGVGILINQSLVFYWWVKWAAWVCSALPLSGRNWNWLLWTIVSSYLNSMSLWISLYSGSCFNS